MFAAPPWTALPRHLDYLLARMLNVREYPVPIVGSARCGMALIADDAPDPHDWHLWRTGTAVVSYENRLQQWPIYLRRCSGCRSIEVRKDGQSEYIASARPGRGAVKRTPGPADVLLGWYQGT